MHENLHRNIACDTVHSAIARLQIQHPSAFIVISGDFNHVTLDNTLPTFTQYVVYPTRGERILDLLYANVLRYVPIVRREPVMTTSIRRWSDEALAELQTGRLCKPHSEDINGLTECITDYINCTIDIKALLNDKKKAFSVGNGGGGENG